MVVTPPNPPEETEVGSTDFGFPGWVRLNSGRIELSLGLALGILVSLALDWSVLLRQPRVQCEGQKNA